MYPPNQALHVRKSIGETNLACKWKTTVRTSTTTINIVLTKAFAEILEHGDIPKNGSTFA